MSTPSRWVEEAAAVLGGRGRRDAPLGPLTTYRGGGAAAMLLRVDDEADLLLAREAVLASGADVLVVGRGSNLLVADGGFDGLAVVLGEAFAAVEVDADAASVRAGGAASLPVVARRTAAAGLSGLEWAVGVPGSVGGAVRMNAGGHGSDIAATLVRAWLFDLRPGPGTDPGPAPVPVATAGLALGYRRSAVVSSQVVVAAELALSLASHADAEAKVAEVVRWRREHQPGGANAGSVFANPPGDSAGRLVDAAGLRGHRRGSAFVSPKHANFFQLDDGGSTDDIVALMDEVRSTVHQRFNVQLEPEVRLVGFGTRQL